MATKKMSLNWYLLKCLKENNPRGVKRIKGVIGTLIESEDFATVLTMLDGQNKDLPETIQFYEALFRRFRLNSHLVVDGGMTKEEWHGWTAVLLKISSVLWQFRKKFKPGSWLETNKKIYDITFQILKNYDSEKRNHKECKYCSRLFSGLLAQFSDHAEYIDIDGFQLPSLEKLKELCAKNIGLDWEHLIPSRRFEEKFNSVVHT